MLCPINFDLFELQLQIWLRFCSEFIAECSIESFFLNLPTIAKVMNELPVFLTHSIRAVWKLVLNSF